MELNMLDEYITSKDFEINAIAIQKRTLSRP